MHAISSLSIIVRLECMSFTCLQRRREEATCLWAEISVAVIEDFQVKSGIWLVSDSEG